MLIFSCLFLTFSQNWNTAVLTLKDKLCIKCCFTALFCISTFVLFLMPHVICLDTQVRANITCHGCAKTEQRNSQAALRCCLWQCSVCMKEFRSSDAFALNANWVSCWNCPLIPLLTLCCCCSLLPCRFISFRYQRRRTDVSDREKVILIHLLPLLWLLLPLFSFLSVNEGWPVFSFGQDLIFIAVCA